MSKILKKNTAILQVPEKVINDKNKLINSTTNKGDLKKGTIKIETGKNLKIVSKGTLINQGKEVKPKPTKEVKPKPTKEVKPKPIKEPKKEPTKEPEKYKYNGFGTETLLIIKPLTEKKLKKYFNTEQYGYIDSVEKFNKLNFERKYYIERNLSSNDEIISEAITDFVDNNYEGEWNDNKAQYKVDKLEKNFIKTIKELRKKSKSEFLDYLGDYSKTYRFIF